MNILILTLSSKPSGEDQRKAGISLLFIRIEGSIDDADAIAPETHE